MPGPTHPTGGPRPRVAKGNLLQAHRAVAKVDQLGRAALEGAGSTHRIGRKVERAAQICVWEACPTDAPPRAAPSQLRPGDFGGPGESENAEGRSPSGLRGRRPPGGREGRRKGALVGRRGCPPPTRAQGSSAWKTAMTGSSWVVTTRTLRNLSKSMSSCERRVFSWYMISSRWWRPRK